MTEPTDAEIIAVMRDGYNCRYNDEADHIDFARAVLAKWGTQPVACEPLTDSQAQAGAVPLTPKQVAEIADAAHREYDRLVGSGQCAPRWSAVFAHLLERAHGIGIKGGQHGAE